MVVTSGQLNTVSSGRYAPAVHTHSINSIVGLESRLVLIGEKVDGSVQQQDISDFVTSSGLIQTLENSNYSTSEDVIRDRTAAMGMTLFDFGAVGDGIADDTLALQNWLNSGQTLLRMSPGRYRITSGLTIDINNVNLDGSGTTIIVDTESGSTAIQVNASDVKIENLNISASGMAGRGILLSGDRASVESCSITNVRSETSYAVGIECTSEHGFRAINNRITDIMSTDNGTMGDSIGAARAIYYSHSSPSLEPSVISGNFISDIKGEEGDGIQIVMGNGNDPTSPFHSAVVTIENNVLWDCTRRYIKVQASDVTVKGNVMSSTYTSSPSNPSECILVSRSDRVNIVNNVINENYLLRPVNVSGNGSYYCHDIVVMGNVTYQREDATVVSISINWVRRGSVVNNITYGGGVGCAAATTDDTVIIGNTSYSTDTTPAAFSANGNGNRVVIKDNLNMNPGKANPFTNYSVGGVLDGNVSLTVA